jgi:hypothetical protein
MAIVHSILFWEFSESGRAFERAGSLGRRIIGKLLVLTANPDEQ